MNLIYKGLLSVGILFAGFIAYTIWDNNRIKVVKEDVVISNLTNQFEEFTILQLSDLHEKTFGRNQKRLIKKVNSLDYDVLVMTGDLTDNQESKDFSSIHQFLDGINNRENILFVQGNADPPSYQLTSEFGKSEFIRGMEERGVQFLESFKTIEQNGESIHFVNFELAIVQNPEQIGNINGMFQPYHAGNEHYQAYQTKLWEEMMTQNVLESGDTLIALNHYPVPDIRVDYIESDPDTIWRNFDLIMAGHYHGGQVRLPFIGALFIPDPWYEPTSFFPPQDRVKGLWEYKQTKQYVSAGLGSSDAIPFIKFRLFNPPEINLVTLKAR